MIPGSTYVSHFNEYGPKCWICTLPNSQRQNNNYNERVENSEWNKTIHILRTDSKRCSRRRRSSFRRHWTSKWASEQEREKQLLQETGIKTSRLELVPTRLEENLLGEKIKRWKSGKEENSDFYPSTIF
jgi:hypothetical protein